MRKRVIIFVILLALMITLMPATVFAEEDGLKEETIDGAVYVLNQDGSAASEGWHDIDMYWYYVEAGGKAAIGWRKIDGNWYWFEDNGHMCTRMVAQIDGKYYSFKSSGAMRENEWIEFNKENNYWSYAGADGAWAEGWRYINGKWYYFTGPQFIGSRAGTEAETSDGIWPVNYPVAVTKDTVIGTELHGFDSSGAWTGQITSEGWKQIGTWRWFYVCEDGSAAVGWKQINGSWYYFHIGEDYARGYMRRYAVDVDGIRWFLYESGVLREEEGWVKTGMYGEHHWMYLNSNGSLRTGWVEDGGKWYYLDYAGVMVSGMGRYYIDGKYYAFSPDGSMRIGWVKEGDYWYYYGADGALYTNGTYTINGTSYTFDRYGKMQ
ncbi:MAG: hypothetical protein J5928_02545 [Firmicutes bacterium]|nr:hypothetical protein [Bacillota bacterium]